MTTKTFRLLIADASSAAPVHCWIPQHLELEPIFLSILMLPQAIFYG